MVNCNTLCHYRKRVRYLGLIISQHANGCFLFCLNQNLPNLTVIDKFLILMFILFALNFNIQSSGFGITSCFHPVLKYCGISSAIFFAVLRYLPNFLQYCGVQKPPMSPSIKNGTTDW